MKRKLLTRILPLKAFIQLSIGPVLFMAFLIATHLVFEECLKQYFVVKPKTKLLEQSVFSVLLLLSAYWLFVRFINKTISLMKSNVFADHAFMKIILPLCSAVFKTLAFLVLFNILVQYLDIYPAMSFILTKVTSILIIGSISWILCRVVDVSEELFIQYYLPKKNGSIAARKIHTQTHILKRILYTLIIILTLGAILMLFDNVRALGASVLTTAGVMGLVFTLTAQKSLGSILSGLEIAITQPIKIGDTIVIQNEFGTVEEINFRSVVVKLWDWRRLVVPTNYFLENIFQNWSRDQHNNLIGVVYLFVDFTLPVEKVREELNSILDCSPLWDRKVGNITINDLQVQVMQLRVLASAKNADDVSKLRNEIREKLIHYIVTHYPESLPKSRTINLDSASSSEPVFL